MKPPLTVEAKVAEELRNWLASELEQLDASNTNQFAHHVVTILLHEDLDIEDEPLTAGDDFFHDIYNIRKGKTRDRQKKAAVQFLRSAVCCDESDEAEIQEVVEELMVKIDETKNKMNNKRASKRSLLAPIAINVTAAASQTCAKSDGSEEERRYNEAFPSLAGEESPCKEGAARLSNSVWNRSPSVGKENKKKLKRKFFQYANQHSYMFSCQEEAQACSIARQVAALALAETVLPNAEATEVFPSTFHDSSPSSFNDSSGCWKSAFRTVILTKVFSPTTNPLHQSRPFSAIAVLKTFSPRVIQGTNVNPALDPAYNSTHSPLDPDRPPGVFHPVQDESIAHLFPSGADYSLDDSLETKSADIEICNIFDAGQKREQQLREKVQRIKKPKTKVDTPHDLESDLEHALQFPYHCGSFWQELVYKGAVALYPNLTKPTKTGRETDTETLIYAEEGTAKQVSKPVKDLSALSLESLGHFFTPESIKNIIFNYFSGPGCQIGCQMYPGHVLKAMVEKLLTSKEKALQLISCNNIDQNDEDSFRNEQVLETCVEALTSLFSLDSANPVRSFHNSSAESSGNGNELAEKWSTCNVVDGPDYCEREIDFRHADDKRIAKNDSHQIDLKCNYEMINSSYGDTRLHSYYSDDKLVSFYGLDNNEVDGGFEDDPLCFNDESTSPSITGFSPSFLNKIDLGYLDDQDGKLFDVDANRHFEPSLTLQEKVVLWRNSLEPQYVVEKWPVVCEESTHQTTWQDPHSFGLLDPGYAPPVSPQLLDREHCERGNMFPPDQKQLQWENPWSFTEWDSICKELLAGFMDGCTTWPSQSSPANPFMPSLLTSCLSSEGAQLLQSAFVNSYFSNNFQEPLTQLKESELAVDCSELEKFWLAKEMHQDSSDLDHLWLSSEMHQSFALGFSSAQYELIRGCTCSNWLENNCKLGLLCPFSHPSI